MKKLFIIAIAITLFTSCGKDIPKEKTVTVNNISISGKGKKHIKVVDGSYTFIMVKEDKVIIPIKLKLTKAINLKEPEMGNLTLVPLDKSGVAIYLGFYNSFNPATMSDWGKVKDLLSDEVGQTINVTFDCGGIFLKEEHIEKIMNETVSFELTRTDITSDSNDDKDTSSSNTSNNLEENNNSDIENNETDEALDSYEDYVDQYLKFLKKASNGNASAMSEYLALMQKAIKMQQKIQGMSNDFTTKQMTRMMKIQIKMTNAALEMN